MYAIIIITIKANDKKYSITAPLLYEVSETTAAVSLLLCLELYYKRCNASNLFCRISVFDFLFLYAVNMFFLCDADFVQIKIQTHHGLKPRMMCLMKISDSHFKNREKLLAHSLFNSNSNCNGCANHRVVAYSEEAHHFNMSRNR